jgi:predicted RNase H-like nuclease (RuvC/YqgF family)
MEDGFALLEEKVIKAADLVKRLRKENQKLGEELSKARSTAGDAEKKLAALQKEAAAASKNDEEAAGLRRELDTLKQERGEVRNRIAKLVDLLEGLD